jgi:hypothetical protein
MYLRLGFYGWLIITLMILVQTICFCFLKLVVNESPDKEIRNFGGAERKYLEAG